MPLNTLHQIDSPPGVTVARSHVMETLPIVSFIIYSTGLCTIALLGLSIGDIFTERLKVRALKMSSRAATVSRYATSVETKRSEEHTSELQSLMRISYAVFCL